MAETYYVKPENSPVNDVTLNAGDAMFITNGGTANGAVVNSDGAATVNDGGSANNTTVNEGGTLHLIGGAATGVNVASNGRLEVNKGATATGIEAEKGATLVFDVAADTHIAGTSDGAAFQIQNGVATGFTLETGVLIVSDGGKAVETVLNSAGFINVSQGGSADKAVINTSGELKVSSGGTATEATVKTGGKLTVESSGFCDDATVEMGGNLCVISSGGTAAGTYIGAMGNLAVSKGGTAYGTTVGAGGFLTVGTKGIAEGADVNGFLNVLEGGLASNVTVNEGAVVYIQSKGTGSDVYVDDGGILEAMADGRLKGATVAQGGSATIHADVMASNVVIDGGKVTVMSDGWAYQSGVSSNTIVRNGGRLVVSGGGFVVGAAVSAGGHVTVESDATFSSATVADADVTALDGAFVSRLNLEAGGILNVVSGGTLQNIYVSAGAVLTGVLRDVSELKFYGGTLDLNISGIAPGGEFLIGDDAYTYISGSSYECTLTVDSSAQTAGVYELIEDATGFDKTITVKDTLGTTLGTLMLGGDPLVYGPLSYKLSIDTTGLLSVTVDAGGGITPDITGDLSTTFDLTAGMVGSSVNVLDGGKLNVYKDALASQTTVKTGGSMTVSAGGSADVVTVNDGGRMFVYSGAKISNITDETNGHLIISGGVTVTGFVAVNGAKLTLSVAPDTYVQGTYDGNAFELKDAVLSGFTLKTSGVVNVLDGGVTSDVTVSGGLIRVYNGSVAKDTLVSAGGELMLREEGAVANGVTIKNGGKLTFSEAGGKLTGKVTIETGATVTAETGAILDFDLTKTTTADPALVNNLSFFGTAAVNYTLTVDGTAADGDYKLAEGATGFDKSITVKDTLGTTLGTLTVAGGKTTIDGKDYTLTLTGTGSLGLTLGDGGGITPDITGDLATYYSLAAGKVGSSVNILDGGRLNVSNGGLTSQTTVNSGGDLYVSAGGSADVVTVNYGGDLWVYNGAKATLVKENGGYVYIDGGATVEFVPNSFDGVTLGGAWNWATVHSGTTATNIVAAVAYTTVEVYDGGSANNTTVSSGGIVEVYSGGKANGATIAEFGKLHVSSGGSAIGIVAEAGAGLGFAIAPGTYAQGTYAGSSFEITDTVADYTVNTLCNLDVYDGGTANNTTVSSGGIVNVFNGGKVTGVNITSYGSIYVTPGGSATGIVAVDGARLELTAAPDTYAQGTYAGSAFEITDTVTDFTVHSGCILQVDGGGKADDVTVDSGSYLYVSSGGTAADTTVAAGGYLAVSSGGTATNIAWTPCDGQVYVADGAYATFVSTYTGVYFGSDGELLESVTTMDGKKVAAYYEMYVADGGLVTNTEVDYGDVYVWSGGRASGTTLVNGGYLLVSSGGVADNTTINANGHLFVSSGGVANKTTVNDKGTVEGNSGGLFDGVVVNSGGSLLIYNGAKLTGQMTFVAGAEVIPFVGSILDFDLTQTAPDAAALVNDLSILMGTPGYTITVAGTEASGTYNLAGGVTGFDKTITVMSPLGDEYGTLTVGGSLSTAFADYTLNLSSGVLTLDLVAKVVVDTTPPDKPIPEASSELPTNGYVTVTATFSDDSVLRECSKDGENWVEYQSSGLTFVENGKAYFRATDGAGNVSDIAVYEVTNIDKVAPTISYITPSTTAPAASVTVTASFDDDVSLASTQYRIGDGAWQDYTTGVTVTENTTVYFKAIDAAGNETTDSYEVTNITGGGSVDLTGDLSDSYELTAGKVASSVNILDGGNLEVFEGGFTSQTTVNSGGDLAVSEGGVADVVTVNFGGDLYIRNGGVATLVKENGGYASVNDGATATFVSNSFGGYVYNNADDWCTIHDGTTGSNLTAANKGRIYVYSGGVASNVTVNDGGNLIVSGGKVTGMMTFATGAVVTAETGAVLDFDLTQTTAGAEALVNDLSFALAQPFTYTLTVDGTQSSGTYNLGGNATGFNKIISVKNTSGVDYGYLTFGGTLSTAFANFTLNLTSDDTLTVNVAAKGGSDITPPTITITPSTTELAKSVVMTADFTDNVAVATQQYRIGDGAWLNYEAPFTVTENAVIGFRATDTSGNTTVESYEVQNIQPDAKNEPDNGWNDYLYDKKKGWNKDENISQFASNTISGNGEIHLDPSGLIDLEDMHNMFGNDGINVDSGDVGKIAVTTAAKLSFSIKSTADGTFYIYQDGFDKKGNRKQITVGKVTVKKGKVATLSGICLATDGQYYAAMTAKNVKKPGPSAIYNVTVVDSTIFVDADDGWNNAALNKTVVDNPFKIERGVKTVKLDNVDMIDGGDFNNFVGFSDPVDFAKLKLASTASLSFDIGTNGSAKFTLWKRDTGTGKLTKVGGVTSLKSKKGELVTKSTKAQLLEVGDKYDYFISMECADAAKGGSAYYNVNVNTVSTRFFDSNDGGENNWLFDKKNKAYNDDANLRSNTLSAYGSKDLDLDNTASGDPAFNNFVGFKDSADYAKVVLTKGGSLSFKITALADVTFEIWQKGEDKKGNPALNSLQKKTDVKVKDYAVGASATTDALTLEAGEYYISVTAKSTKANEKGSAFYNVTALFGSSEADALVMPEISDALAMTDSLSFGQYGSDAIADVSAASNLADLNADSGWQNLASLA